VKIFALACALSGCALDAAITTVVSCEAGVTAPHFCYNLAANSLTEAGAYATSPLDVTAYVQYGRGMNDPPIYVKTDVLIEDTITFNGSGKATLRIFALLDKAVPDGFLLPDISFGQSSGTFEGPFLSGSGYGTVDLSFDLGSPLPFRIHYGVEATVDTMSYFTFGMRQQILAFYLYDANGVPFSTTYTSVEGYDYPVALATDTGPGIPQDSAVPEPTSSWMLSAGLALALRTPAYRLRRLMYCRNKAASRSARKPTKRQPY
jgi:hypothetical protein